MTKTYYDYDNQAWVVGGKYIRCGHSESMDCTCYGKLHEGETAAQDEEEQIELEFEKIMDWEAKQSTR